MDTRKTGSEDAYYMSDTRKILHVPTHFITLPYIKSTSELTTRLRRPLGIRVAHKPTSTLRQLLTRTKDPLPTMDRTNVIYKIPCKDCDKH
eukprot:g12744.t1